MFPGAIGNTCDPCPGDASGCITPKYAAWLRVAQSKLPCKWETAGCSACRVQKATLNFYKNMHRNPFWQRHVNKQRLCLVCPLSPVSKPLWFLISKPEATECKNSKFLTADASCQETCPVGPSLRVFFSKTQRSKLCHVVALAHKTCIFYWTEGASALIEQLHTVIKEVENAASARGVVSEATSLREPARLEKFVQDVRRGLALQTWSVDPEWHDCDSILLILCWCSSGIVSSHIIDMYCISR